jgi:alkylhydroperoxidase family enzyme
VRSQGAPDRDAVNAFLAAGFDEVKVLYVILAISVKTLSNFSNHAFATPVDDMFAAYSLG